MLMVLEFTCPYLNYDARIHFNMTEDSSLSLSLSLIQQYLESYFEKGVRAFSEMEKALPIQRRTGDLDQEYAIFHSDLFHVFGYNAYSCGP